MNSEMEGQLPDLNLRRYRIVSKLGSYDEGSFYMIHIKVEPLLDSLRSDSRFTEVMRRVGHVP